MIDLTKHKPTEEALRESVKRLRAILDTTVDAIVTIDERGIIVSFNAAAEKIFGYTAEEAIGQNVKIVMPSPYREEHDGYIRRYLETKQPRIIGIGREAVGQRKDGSPVPVELAVSEVILGDGRRLFTGVLRDITARKQAEEALLQSEARYRALYENIPLMYFTLDADGLVLSVNVEGVEHLGYREEELVGQPVLGVFHEADRQAVREQIRDVVQQPGRVAQWEFRKVRKDGSMLWVREAVRSVKDADGKTIVLVVCEDVTERKQAEQKLAQREEQLRKLASQLVLAEERARREVGRDLHDHIGQILAIVRGRLGALREPEAAETLRPSIDETCALLEQAIEATRTLTFELSSPILYELGLEAALQSLGEQFEKRDGLQFHFETDQRAKPMADDTRVVLYRAARELLFNVVKHGQAHNVWVTIVRMDGHLQLTIKDDGVGFDTARLDEGFNQSGGFGLFSIHQQLDHVGGRFEIEATPGHGTRAVITAPLA